MTGKRALPAAVIALLVCTGCSTNTGTTRNLTKGITDPFFLDGSVVAVAESLTGSQIAIAETLPPVQQKHTLAEFATDFTPHDKGRANNIKTASRSIDEKIVYPGETFSYNETVGPTTKKNGFQKATVYDRGVKKKGYGGGVCQVSSTLYNAAEKAGMAIVERHHHSLPVYYVEEGKDAATSYGAIDFKFKNNKSFPVKINSWTSDKKVVVGIEAI